MHLLPKPHKSKPHQPRAASRIYHPTPLQLRQQREAREEREAFEARTEHLVPYLRMPDRRAADRIVAGMSEGARRDY